MKYRLNNIAESFINKINKVRDQKENDPFAVQRERLEHDLNVIPFACPQLGKYISEKFADGRPITYSEAVTLPFVFSRRIFTEFEHDYNIKNPYTFNEFRLFLNAENDSELNYSEKNYLTEITIPKTWTECDDYSFYCFYSLKKIKFEGTIVRFGKNCFGGCNALKKMVIPKSVRLLGDSCFEGCIGLKRVIIPDTIEIIPERCFSACEKLNNVVLPNSIKIIGKSAFLGCPKLTDIQLPDSLVQLKGDSLAGIGAKEIVLPASLRKIGSGAFVSNFQMEKLIFNSKVNLSNSNIFGGYIGLDVPLKIYLPEKYRTYYSDPKHFYKYFKNRIVYY